MIEELVRSSVALFVVVDPVGNIPILADLTKALPSHHRRRAFNLAILVGSALLLLFAFAGHQILLLFNVSLYSFMVAGGILFLFLALQILVYGGEKLPTRAGDVGVFPIGFPLLAGPGAITNTMITINAHGQIVAVLSVVVVMFTSWLVLRALDRIQKILGNAGSDVVARVMAVFLAAIAIEYIIKGIKGSLFY